MASLAWPLVLSDFFDPLVVSETTFHLPDASEGEQTGAGEILTSSYAPRLWEGSVRIGAGTHSELDAAYARFELLLTAGATFLIRPRHRLGPVGDPLGTILGAATPNMTVVSTDRREITITGLPANYAGIQTGSFLSFTYDSGRRAFHRVVTGRVASGVGSAALIEVTPPIRPNVTLPAAVTLVKPVCKAVVKRDSSRPVRQLPGYAQGFSFDWRQTLAK